MKRASLIMLVVFVVLSCRATDADIQDIKNDIQKLREDIRQDISKLSLRVRKLSTTRSPSEDLIEEFALSGRPRYQSITVVNSTFPEIQTGTTFKSDSYGHHFYFNGYFLTLGKEFVRTYLDEFGNNKSESCFQWGLDNGPFSMIMVQARPSRNNNSPTFLSDKLSTSQDALYPLKLTNHLYSIEFSAPRLLTSPLTSGDTQRR